MTTGAKWVGALTIIVVGLFYFIGAGRVTGSNGVVYECRSAWAMLTSSDQRMAGPSADDAGLNPARLGLTRDQFERARKNPTGTYYKCRDEGRAMALRGAATGMLGVIVTVVMQTRRREDISWFVSDTDPPDGEDR